MTVRFSVEFTWYDGDAVAVSGEYIPGVPERKSGHPDTWAPGYGREISVQRISVNSAELSGLEFDNYASRDAFIAAVDRAIEEG